jgi:hypothetical protein
MISVAEEMRQKLLTPLSSLCALARSAADAFATSGTYVEPAGTDPSTRLHVGPTVTPAFGPLGSS